MVLTKINHIDELKDQGYTILRNVLDPETDIQPLINENVQVLIHKEGSTYWRQNILVSKKRDNLLKFLQSNNIKASKYFPSINKLFYPNENGRFINSKTMAEQIINLWPGEKTSLKDIHKTNDLIQIFYENN